MAHAWSGLGKEETGSKAPINVVMREERAGLGSGSVFVIFITFFVMCMLPVVLTWFYRAWRSPATMSYLQVIRMLMPFASVLGLDTHPNDVIYLSTIKQRFNSFFSTL